MAVLWSQGRGLCSPDITGSSSTGVLGAWGSQLSQGRGGGENASSESAPKIISSFDIRPVLDCLFTHHPQMEVTARNIQPPPPLTCQGNSTEMITPHKR